MRYKAKIFSFILAVLCFGCHDFYYGYQDGDVWRLPLLDPYELRTTAGASPNDNYFKSWRLTFHTIRVDRITDGLNITMVNVSKGIIYGYGSEYPAYHFIIKYAEKEEKIYKSTSEWEKELISLQVDPKKIVSVWTLFEIYKKDGILQWHKQE